MAILLSGLVSWLFWVLLLVKLTGYDHLSWATVFSPYIVAASIMFAALVVLFIKIEITDIRDYLSERRQMSAGEKNLAHLREAMKHSMR